MKHVWLLQPCNVLSRVNCPSPSPSPSPDRFPKTLAYMQQRSGLPGKSGVLVVRVSVNVFVSNLHSFFPCKCRKAHMLKWYYFLYYRSCSVSCSLAIESSTVSYNSCSIYMSRLFRIRCSLFGLKSVIGLGLLFCFDSVCNARAWWLFGLATLQFFKCLLLLWVFVQSGDFVFTWSPV